MESVFDTLCGFIIGLLGLVAGAMFVVEMTVRSALSTLGLTGAVQNACLLLLLVALILLAFRIFGRLLAVLVTAAAVVFLIHALIGSPMQPGRNTPAHAPTVSL